MSVDSTEVQVDPVTSRPPGAAATRALVSR